MIVYHNSTSYPDTSELSGVTNQKQSLNVGHKHKQEYPSTISTGHSNNSTESVTIRPLEVTSQKAWDCLFFKYLLLSHASRYKSPSHTKQNIL